MTRIRLVCFVGIDGSGKTTIAKSVINDMKQLDISCRYVWSRGTPKVFMPLIIFAKRFILRTSGRVLSTDERNPFNRTLASNKLLSHLWQTMLILDSLLQVTLNVRIPMKLGTVVICDRYIFDQMVDIAVDLRLSATQFERWAHNSVYRLFPRPNLTFLMDANELKAFARQQTDVRSINELRLRRTYYLLLSRINHMIVIDASEEYINVSRAVRQRVANAMVS